MERKIVQDVFPPDSKTIRKIPVPEYRQIKINRRPSPPREKSRMGVWIVALLCIVFLIFSVTLLFSSALVKVTPKEDSAAISGSFTARKDAASKDLRYDIMTVEKEGSETAASTGTREVANKARGEIMIYNNYSNASQILTKNTRFENTKGKIYRIADAVTVPGKRTLDGKEVAGSVVATVYADEAGESYNMALSGLAGDFKIPGFKGTAKYSGFFARLKSDITGGESGRAPVVDEKSLEEARIRIRLALKEELFKDAFAQKPDGFLLFDNAFSIRYESLPSVAAGAGKVNVREKAVFYGIMFNKKALAQAILPAFSQSIIKDEVAVEGLESLRFDIPAGQAFSPETSGSLNFTLKGAVRVVYQFPEDKLKQDLAGKAAKYIPLLLEKYPGIKSADVTIRPFWKRSFPSNEDRITIEKLTQ